MMTFTGRNSVSSARRVSSPCVAAGKHPPSTPRSPCTDSSLSSRGCPPSRGSLPARARLPAPGGSSPLGNAPLSPQGGRRPSHPDGGLPLHGGAPLLSQHPLLLSLPPVPPGPNSSWADVALLARAGGPEASLAVAGLRRVLAKARAPGTLARYSGWAQQLLAFAASLRLSKASWPCSPAVVSLWVASLAAKGLAPSTIEGAVAAVAWSHRAGGHADPTVDPLVRLALDGAVRSNARPIHHSGAFTLTHITSLVAHLTASSELVHLRTAAMLVLAFGALLRLDELVHLRIGDVDIEPLGLSLYIARSKTDQRALGSRKFVASAPAGAQVCPVRTFTTYRARLLRVAALPLGLPLKGPLWPQFSGGVPAAVLWAKAVSKDGARRALSDALLACGLTAYSYTWHSCRAGGATSVSQAGVAPLTVQALGGWSSGAYRSYVRHGDADLRAAARAVWTAPSLPQPPPCVLPPRGLSPLVPPPPPLATPPPVPTLPLRPRLAPSALPRRRPFGRATRPPRRFRSPSPSA